MLVLLGPFDVQRVHCRQVLTSETALDEQLTEDRHSRSVRIT